ncbi:Zn-finger in Ran binding protein [Necator americanus]|uniref:Zn-finger in Ran binding protein n=1 Tax=Necator americanus TaxID=51031 RepID=W2SPL2_NECAM|nr:Zn-finger in Ran binding protein [Necator americanus]ETN70771.1 Zn-finger in Ran binding protein [Necator americanus]
MSEKDGWLSAVSKLFSSGQRPSNASPERRCFEMQEPPEECAVPKKDIISSNGSKRGLRYLSPSVLDSSISKPSVSKPIPTEDIFTGSKTPSRKRLLAQDERPATAMDGLFFRDNPKRFRREHLGHSMLEDLSSRVFSDHFDSPWLDRTIGGSSSCVDFTHSPSSSNRSLIGRIGSNRSNSSSLSSKTKAILSHLERINTPARATRKLPVMRGSTVPSERWAPLHIGVAPPLIRSSATVPSRIQLLSTSLASQRKPYWRDITRKGQEKEKSSARKDVGEPSKETSVPVVHPLFDLEYGTANAVSSVSTKRGQEQSTSASLVKVQKQTEKNKDERKEKSNVFNACELIDEEMDGVDNDDSDELTFAPPTKATPSVGATDDVSFSFAAPIERLPGQYVSSHAMVGEKSGSESDGEESNCGESAGDQSSSTSDEEELPSSAKDVKTSRPPTAADSETSAAISSSITPVSSKDVSPQAKPESSWECPDCFITNKNVLVCAACGHNKDGSKTTKTLVSNISTFGKSVPTTGIQFGISAEKMSNGGFDQPSGTKPSDAAPAKASAPTFGSTEPAATSVAKTTDTGSTSITSQQQSATISSTDTSKTQEPNKERTAWECPDCMVQNKATDDKCVCCGHVKYKSGSEESSASSVFGNRAFKPAPSSGFSFGFGAGSNATTTAPVKFGFGTNTTKENSEVKASTGITSAAPAIAVDSKPASVISTQPVKGTQPALLKTTSSPAFLTPVSKTEEPKAQTPAFTLGAGSSLFGAGAKPPLFGSSSTSMFSASSSTGSLLPFSSTTQAPTSQTPAVTASEAASTTTSAAFTFGATSATNAPKPFGLFEPKKDDTTLSSKAPTFGSGLVFGSVSNPQTQVSSSGTTAVSSSTEISAGASSTLGAGLFGAMPNKPLFPPFGTSVEAPKPLFGASSSSVTEPPKPSLFGASQVSSPPEATKPSLFGASASAPASKPLFGGMPAAPAANGGLNFNFGTNNAFSGFGAAASSTSAAAPSLSSNSSTTSLFGGAQTAPDTSKPFQFNATLPDTTFQFGQAPLAGPAPFQFGSSQPSAPAASSFGATGIAAPAAPSSNFAFTSSSTRKMVAARRRLPQRK